MCTYYEIRDFLKIFVNYSHEEQKEAFGKVLAEELKLEDDYDNWKDKFKFFHGYLSSLEE